jgi:exopolysaccharide biosynthesis predicted pyruvyltransferase EpsI
VDISASGTHCSDPRVFLRFIDQFSVIAIDRFHVAIGAMLLGKRVWLLEGSYFKIRAIFNSSMKGINIPVASLNHLDRVPGLDRNQRNIAGNRNPVGTE